MKTMGASAFLAVFLILCLVVFAGLSISTAKSSLDKSRKSAERTSSYYEACNKAENYLSDVTDGKTNDSHRTIAITDEQCLKVSIRLTGTNEIGGHSYEITGWQVVNTADKNYDQPLELY